MVVIEEAIIKVPEKMVPYINPDTKHEELQRNAMIMYPYIKNGVVSYGRAAQILGIKKWDLIKIYNDLGLSYLSSVSNYEEDLITIAKIKEKI